MRLTLLPNVENGTGVPANDQGEGFERSTWTLGWDQQMIHPRDPLMGLQMCSLGLVHYARLMGLVPFARLISRRGNEQCLMFNLQGLLVSRTEYDAHNFVSKLQHD